MKNIILSVILWGSLTAICIFFNVMFFENPFTNLFIGIICGFLSATICLKFYLYLRIKLLTTMENNLKIEIIKWQRINKKPSVVIKLSELEGE